MVYTPEERSAIEAEMDAYLVRRDLSISDHVWSYHKNVASILLCRMEDLSNLYQQHAPVAEVNTIVNIISTLNQQLDFLLGQ